MRLILTHIAANDRPLQCVKKRMRTALRLLVCLPVLLATLPAESTTIRTHDGYTLYAEKIGNGEQVVIIPGGFLLSEFKQLASPQRTVIFYDMRNRGRSQSVKDTSAINIENDVRDLESVRAHFKVKRFVPIGYSYLGMMVMLYASQHPGTVERAVQLGPVPLKFGTPYPKEFDNTSDQSPLDGKEWEALRALKKEGFDQSHPREYCERFWKFFRPMLVGDPAKAVRMESQCAMENEWPSNFERHLKAHFEDSVQKMNVPWDQITTKVTMPVLTIHGRKDRNVPYAAGREWATKLPDARLISLDNAAHNSWVDAPTEVFSAIKTFLDGKWPSNAEKITAT